MSIPPAVYDYDVAGRALTLLKQREVPGYDLGTLVEWREWATAPDGTRVPMSLVRPASVTADGSAPGLLAGYGAYGYSSDPGFSVARLSLLDRGVVCAIAHVRGGTELGWDWYVRGRLEHKENTFDDFVTCADHFVESGWVAPNRLAAQGASAGGLLMGAVANRAPELFRAIHAEVPFVDVLTTILDKSLPLTVTEWEEWGNPVADPDGIRADQGVLALRQRRGARLPGAAGDDEPARRAGVRDRAGQVGGSAAGGLDVRPGQPAGPLPHAAHLGSRRPVRALRRVARARLGAGGAAGLSWAPLRPSAPRPTPDASAARPPLSGGNRLCIGGAEVRLERVADTSAARVYLRRPRRNRARQEGTLTRLD